MLPHILIRWKAYRIEVLVRFIKNIGGESSIVDERAKCGLISHKRPKAF